MMTIALNYTRVCHQALPVCMVRASAHSGRHSGSINHAQGLQAVSGDAAAMVCKVLSIGQAHNQVDIYQKGEDMCIPHREPVSR